MEVESIFYKKLDGPIMYMDDSHAPSLRTKFLQLEKEEKEQHLKKMLQDQEEEKEEEQQTSRSWRKLLKTVFGKMNEKTESKNSVDWSVTTNLYDKKPDFRNDYGWSKTLDGGQYPPLTKPDIGVFHVYLTSVCKLVLQYLRVKAWKSTFIIQSKLTFSLKKFKFWFCLAFEYL